MTTYEEVFFSLVRNSLWETPVVAPPDFKEWKRVIRMANVQAMHGAVARGMLASPEILEPLPEAVYVKMNDMMMTNVYMHTKSNCYVQLLVKSLKAEGVESVLLKGQGLAVNYPNPHVRQCGDIDLYVGVENYRKSYEIIKHLVDEIDDVSVLESDGKHYHAQISGTMIEVHKYSEVASSLLFDGIYQRYAEEGLSQNLVQVEFGDVSVATPADDFNAFYIFSHLWNHFLMGGVGLRQVCDWTIFLHSRASTLNHDYLSNILTDMKLMAPWQTFGCIAVDVLGLPEQEFPFYNPKYKDKAMKVLERILKEGNFGRQTEFMRRPKKGYYREKLYSLKCYVKRYSGMITLFPYHIFQRLHYSVVGGIKRLFADKKRR